MHHEAQLDTNKLRYTSFSHKLANSGQISIQIQVVNAPSTFAVVTHPKKNHKK